MEIFSLAFALAGVIATSFLFTAIVRKRKQMKTEPTLQDKVTLLAEQLGGASRIITELETEITKRNSLVQELEADVERYNKLKDINREQIQAIACRPSAIMGHK